MNVRTQWGMWLLCCCCVLGLTGWHLTGEEDGPGKLEISGAEHRLKKFEQKVRLMRGQPFKLMHAENEALKRIAALHEKYPNHPKVKELFARARKALLASKGETVEKRPEWMRFRENAKRLLLTFAAEGDKLFEGFKAKALADKGVITKPFPPPDPRKVNAQTIIGRKVVLTDFQYPDNEFSSLSRQYCYVGSGSRGYYYVELSTREWLGAYEAIRRYRRELGVEIPQEVGWTVVGEITGLNYLVPQAGKKKTMRGHVGWLVKPLGIYIPGHTCGLSDLDRETGGYFAGEDRVEEIKSSMYSVKSIPDDVTPERLVEIFSIAIRERNYKLYLECIDPRRRKTPKGLSRIQYHWELHQHRFATFYVHITVEKAKLYTVQGFDSTDKLQEIFLTEEDKKRIRETAEPLIKEAEVKSRAFDERGRQYGSPKPHFLRKVEDQRWYILNYPQPF